jgi:hypothetical protein
VKPKETCHNEKAALDAWRLAPVHRQMKFKMSLFVDAFLGSGVPLAGDPITSFQNVPLLGLQTATVLDNCAPMARDVVKVRFIARNCGERLLGYRRLGCRG